MSSALVRQALEFVSPEVSDNKRRGNKRRSALTRDLEGTVQGLKHPYKQKNSKSNKKIDKSQNINVKDNIKKLLALSTPVAKGIATDKILQRAIKGKPLLEKVEKPKEEEKSILFPEEESFKEFEKTYFCS